MAQRDLTVNVGWQDSQLQRGTRQSANSVRQLGKEIERSQREIDRVTKKIADDERRLEQERIQRQQRIRAAMEQTGQTLIGVGTGMLAATGAAVKAAIDWESAWTGVTKTVDGNAQQMAVLEQSLRDLTKVLPASHQEIAAVAEAAGQLGIQREAITGFTKTMIDLGNTTNLTAEDAATSIAQIANVMGTSQQDVDRFGSALVELGNNGASTEAEILEMTKRLAGAGNLIGASETDVLALANAMASIGISAEAGGGSMSRVMQKIYESVQEGSGAVEGFARVAGMSAKEFTAAFERDPVRAINAFIVGLNNVERSGGNVVGTLKDLGIRSSEDLRTVLGLKGATDLLTQSLDMGNRAWQENTALTDEANKRYETAAAQIEMAWNKIKDAAITVGGAIAPVIAGAADAVGTLAEWFSNLPGPVQKALGILGAAGGTLSILAGAALLAVPRIRDTRDALRDLGVTGDRVTGKLKGLAKVASVGGVVYAALTGLGAAADAAFGDNLDIDIDALTVGLKRWAESGKVAGEMARLFGEDLGGLDDALTQLTVSGAEKSIKEFLNLDAALNRAKGAFSDLDGVLSSLVKSGDVDTAKMLFGRIAEEAERMGYSTEDVKANLPGYAAALEVAGTKAKESAGGQNQLADGVQGVADSTQDATKALDDYVEAQRAATDPVFALHRAMKQADEAQRSYNDAVRQHGERSPQARDAAWQLAEAVAGAEQAALDGDLSFGEFQAKLDQWVRQGKITRGQADILAGRVRNLRGEAEDYRGNYRATLHADTKKAEAAIKGGTERMRANLSALKGTTVSIGAKFTFEGQTYTTFGPPSLRYAEGGLYEDHRAQIAPAGAMRLWAEPETGGEAYIPLSPAKRGRSMAVLREVADRFGVDMFANGGLINPQPRVNVRSTKALADAVNSTLYGAIQGKFAEIINTAAGHSAAGLMASSGSYPSGGSGVQRWRGVGLQALAIAGQPLTEINRLLYQMTTESGGNPNIVNRWDSNWARGTPSVGLMQVIGPTYQAYKHPRFDTGPYMYGTSVNPLSNILASIRYSLARYGSLAAAWRGTGYDEGGIASGRGIMAKKVLRPERVLSPRQTESFERLVSVLDSRRGVEGAASRTVNIRVTGELVERNGNVVGLVRDVVAQELNDDRGFRGR